MVTKDSGLEVVKHGSLAEALATFQMELPTISKDNTATVATKTGPGFSYSYAGLDTVSEIVLPLLGKHGLSFTAAPTLKIVEGIPPMVVLKYKLMHESGDKLTGMYPLPAVGTPGQVMGSAITYARRYSLLAVTGVFPGGEDDDGAEATQYQKSQNNHPSNQRSRQQASAPPPRPVTGGPAPQELIEEVQAYSRELRLSGPVVQKKLEYLGFQDDIQHLGTDAALALAEQLSVERERLFASQQIAAQEVVIEAELVEDAD